MDVGLKNSNAPTQKKYLLALPYRNMMTSYKKVISLIITPKKMTTVYIGCKKHGKTAVGDFVKVLENDSIPADLFICSTSEDEIVAYIKAKGDKS